MRDFVYARYILYSYIMANIGLTYIYFHILVSHLLMSDESERQNELIQLVNSIPNNTWTAGRRDDVSSSDAHETNTKRLLRRLRLVPFASSELPQSFDARKKWSSHEGDPNERCPTLRKVINNGKCKCGWATSIAAVVSDRMCISSKYKIKQPLSAQQLISCCTNCCSCNGGDVRIGWEYVKRKGLVTGGPYKSNIGCQPFLIQPCHRTYECSTKNSKVPECWENTCDPNVNNLNKTGIYVGESYMKMQISDYYSIPRKDHVRIMKELIVSGLLQVSMHMYEDFRVYTKGIYTHQVGELVCEHGVKLIGWGIDDGHKHWLVMNSFGVLWGEQGLFKIAMNLSDNSDFGYTIIAPKFYTNTAYRTHYSDICMIIVICIVQILQHLYKNDLVI